MPTEKIFFGNDQRSGDHELAGASPLAINVLVDGQGTVRRRPGISAWDGFPATIPEASPVTGMHAFEDTLVYVNGNRHFYRVTPSTATTADLSTGGGNSYLAGTARPVFAETPFRLVIAGGAAPEKLDKAETVMERLGGSPPIATHVAYQSLRLILNDQTDDTTIGLIRTSDARGNVGEETWDALSSIRASANPDPVVGLFSNSNELFAFGSESLQVFTASGNDQFNAGLAPQRAVNRGCVAPYSIVESDETLGWFDEKRRFLTSDGRGVDDISGPIARTLDGIDTVSDCFGFRWMADQYDVLCWVFPTDGRTFAVQTGGGWAQWHGWTTGQGHTILPITSHYYWPEQNLHLVGLESGQIAKLDTAAYDDLGETIKAEVVTGFIDHGSVGYKHCELVRFIFRRGHTSSTTEDPEVLLSWRDDLGAFCSPVRLSLGLANDNVFAVERRSLGTYRSRQWKLEFTEALDYVLARAEETYNAGVREED